MDNILYQRKEINTLRVIRGDVIEAAKSSEYDLFIHGCNCKNTFGSGVAKLVREQIPQMWEADCTAAKYQRNRLGEDSLAHVTKRTVGVNAYTQVSFGNDRQHFDYNAFLSVISENIFISGDLFQPLKICMPKIGCGLGGGKWEVVEEMLLHSRFTYDVEFDVYVME